MSAITWDGTGTRAYETGVSKGVLYPLSAGVYSMGYAWNGLTGVTESPSGADPSDLYADDILYASLRAAEKYGATIECYTFPAKFAECNGFASLTTGVLVGQQARTAFGLCYRTKVGTDANEDSGYKLHIVYGATANPSERAYQTVNDSPEPITFSFEITTVPVVVTGFKPTAYIEIDSRTVDATKLAAFEKIIYGDVAVEPRLPLPDEVKTLLTAA